MFRPLFDINVPNIFKARDLRFDFGLIEVTLILLRKSSHIPYPNPIVRNIILDRCDPG
jgi:hypothetical protein